MRLLRVRLYVCAISNVKLRNNEIFYFIGLFITTFYNAFYYQSFIDSSWILDEKAIYIRHCGESVTCCTADKSLCFNVELDRSAATTPSTANQRPA